MPMGGFTVHMVLFYALDKSATKHACLTRGFMADVCRFCSAFVHCAKFCRGGLNHPKTFQKEKKTLY